MKYVYIILSVLFSFLHFNCNERVELKDINVNPYALKASFTSNEYKHIKELKDSDEYMYAYSRYAKPGKITLFVTSAHWCGKCQALLNSIDAAYENKLINKEDVETYVVKLTKDKRDTKQILNTRPFYKMLKEVDLLTGAYPTTYICSPTTNCYGIVEGNLFDKILQSVNELTEAKNKYFDLNYLITDVSNASTCDYLQSENQRLRAIVSELKSGSQPQNLGNTTYHNTIPHHTRMSVSSINCGMNNSNKMRLSFDTDQKYDKKQSNLIINATSIYLSENTITITGPNVNFSNAQININDNIGFIPDINPQSSSLVISFPCQILSHSPILGKSDSHRFFIDIFFN